MAVSCFFITDWWDKRSLWAALYPSGTQDMRDKCRLGDKMALGGSVYGSGDARLENGRSRRENSWGMWLGYIGRGGAGPRAWRMTPLSCLVSTVGPSLGAQRTVGKVSGGATCVGGRWPGTWLGNVKYLIAIRYYYEHQWGKMENMVVINPNLLWCHTFSRYERGEGV